MNLNVVTISRCRYRIISALTRYIVMIMAFLCFWVLAANSQPRIIKLPRGSNVYQDTFAIYWDEEAYKKHTDAVIYLRKNTFDKDEETPKLVVSTYFDDELLVIEKPDSLFVIPYDPEFTSYWNLIIRPPFWTRSSEGSALKILPRNDKIEALLALVRTNGSIDNLVLLGEAFEKEECYVNAYWILKRLIDIDSEKGKMYFDRFYRRHYSLFNPGSVAR